MNMKELMDILNEFIQKNLKILIIFLIILINITGFLITNNNKYLTYLFYPNKKKTKLIAERREVFKGKNKNDQIEKIIEELFLGPMNPDIDNIFPRMSKVLSAKIEGKTLILNLSKSTVMDLEIKERNDVLLYNLLLQSIVNSVHFKYNDIKNVVFNFDGKIYKYIGKYGPIDDGIYLNNKVLE